MREGYCGALGRGELSDPHAKALKAHHASAEVAGLDSFSSASLRAKKARKDWASERRARVCARAPRSLLDKSLKLCGTWTTPLFAQKRRRARRPHFLQAARSSRSILRREPRMVALGS